MLDTPSTTPSKPATKGSKTQGGATKESPVPGSPALMPKLPRPVPARSMHPLSQGQDVITQVPPTGPGPDQGHSSKRKLNLEVQVGSVVEGITNTGAVDPSDSGVKVIGKNDKNHRSLLSRYLTEFYPLFCTICS
jgi:hypothetical protein